MNSKLKVGIVGVGNVGSTLAFCLAINDICDEILLKDIRIDFAKAISLDVSQAAKTQGSGSVIKAIESKEDFKDCNIVVITAGIARKPGMSRDDLLLKNVKIMQDIIEEVIVFNKDAIIIIVSNPLDAMVYTALKASRFPRNKIIGMAGILDSSRMEHFILEELEDKELKIKACVIGGHGNEMLPLPNFSTINNQPLEDYLTTSQINKVVKKTKNAGIEIVNLLKTGSAYYAPGLSTFMMIKAIIADTKEIFPCTVSLEGEYGYTNIVAGVPIRLGKNGCEEIINLKLNTLEKEYFDKSILSIEKLINTLNQKLHSF